MEMDPVGVDDDDDDAGHDEDNDSEGDDDNDDASWQNNPASKGLERPRETLRMEMALHLLNSLSSTNTNGSVEASKYSILVKVRVVSLIS